MITYLIIYSSQMNDENIGEPADTTCSNLVA